MKTTTMPSHMRNATIESMVTTTPEKGAALGLTRSFRRVTIAFPAFRAESLCPAIDVVDVPPTDSRLHAVRLTAKFYYTSMSRETGQWSLPMTSA